MKNPILAHVALASLVILCGCTKVTQEQVAQQLPQETPDQLASDGGLDLTDGTQPQLKYAVDEVPREYGVVLTKVVPAVYASTPPPELPVYQQPPMPGEGYIWTPGYWAWGAEGYYWVPGAWTEPPYVGALWTPGYWAFVDGRYGWYSGYWGPHIGFYGGVDYGFGYVGTGFFGGYWLNGALFYNQAYNNFASLNVTNVYEKTVTVVNNTRVAYNGGSGGLTTTATPQERAALNAPRRGPMGGQVQLERQASQTRQNYASVNHGRPALAAVSRPLEGHTLPAPKFVPAASHAGANAAQAHLAEPHAATMAAHPGGAESSAQRAATVTSAKHAATAGRPATASAASHANAQSASRVATHTATPSPQKPPAAAQHLEVTRTAPTAETPSTMHAEPQASARPSTPAAMQQQNRVPTSPQQQMPQRPPAQPQARPVAPQPRPPAPAPPKHK